MPRYELVEGSSNKFWDIAVAGKVVTVRWGRIGTSGQEKVHTFGGSAEAQREHDKLVAEKTKKGYRLAGPEASGTASSGGKSSAGNGQPKPSQAAKAAGRAKLDAKTRKKVEKLAEKADEIEIDDEAKALRLLMEANALVEATDDPIRQVVETKIINLLLLNGRETQARPLAEAALARWISIGAKDGDNFVQGTWDELARILQGLGIEVAAKDRDRVARLWAECAIDGAHLRKDEPADIYVAAPGTPLAKLNQAFRALHARAYDEAIALGEKAAATSDYNATRNGALIAIYARFAKGAQAEGVSAWKETATRWLKEKVGPKKSASYRYGALVAIAIAHDVAEPRLVKQLIDAWKKDDQLTSFVFLDHLG